MDVLFSVTRFPLKKLSRTRRHRSPVCTRPPGRGRTPNRPAPARRLRGGIPQRPRFRHRLRHSACPTDLRTCRHTTDEGPRQRASGRRTGGDTAGLTQAAPSATGSPAGHNGAARKRHPGAGERKPADAVHPRHSWGTDEVCPSVEMFHAKEDGMAQDAETLSGRVANNNGRESDCGRWPPQSCEAAWRAASAAVKWV